MRESVELQRYASDKYYHKEILLIYRIHHQLKSIREGQKIHGTHEKMIVLFGEKLFKKMAVRLKKIRKVLSNHHQYPDEEIISKLQKLMTLEALLKWDIVLLRKAFADEPNKLKDFNL